MIKILLSGEQRKELESFRRQASAKDSEKALMVLMSNGGMSVPKIASTLKRNPHTIRDWLKRYKANGIKGLARNFSPGRPDTKRRQLMQFINDIISVSPSEYGYQDSAWTVPLIAYHAKKQLDFSVSRDTVIRALKSMGYTYKRPSKTVPAHAPSPEEKRSAVKRIINDIKQLMSKKETVIYALDEAHFSTEPYLVQGWFKKRWPPQDTDSRKEGTSHFLWLLESDNTKVLLEKIHKI